MGTQQWLPDAETHFAQINASWKTTQALREAWQEYTAQYPERQEP